jgi:hypothetical protein
MVELYLRSAPEARHELAQAGRPGYAKQRGSPGGATHLHRIIASRGRCRPSRGWALYITYPGLPPWANSFRASGARVGVGLLDLLSCNGSGIEDVRATDIETHPLLRAQKPKSRSPQRMGHPAVYIACQ